MHSTMLIKDFPMHQHAASSVMLPVLFSQRGVDLNQARTLTPASWTPQSTHNLPTTPALLLDGLSFSKISRLLSRHLRIWDTRHILATTSHSVPLTAYKCLHVSHSTSSTSAILPWTRPIAVQTQPARLWSSAASGEPNCSPVRWPTRDSTGTSFMLSSLAPTVIRSRRQLMMLRDSLDSLRKFCSCCHNYCTLQKTNCALVDVLLSILQTNATVISLSSLTLDHTTQIFVLLTVLLSVITQLNSSERFVATLHHTSSSRMDKFRLRSVLFTLVNGMPHMLSTLAIPLVATSIPSSKLTHTLWTPIQELLSVTMESLPRRQLPWQLVLLLYDCNECSRRKHPLTNYIDNYYHYHSFSNHHDNHNHYDSMLRMQSAK